MLLHAHHAADSGFSTEALTSKEAEVLVLALAFFNQIPCNVYQKCAKKTEHDNINVSRIAQVLGSVQCTTLLGICMHSLDVIQCFC
jgi:hypothetical protein